VAPKQEHATIDKEVILDLFLGWEKQNWNASGRKTIHVDHSSQLPDSAPTTCSDQRHVAEFILSCCCSNSSQQTTFTFQLVSCIHLASRFMV